MPRCRSPAGAVVGGVQLMGGADTFGTLPAVVFSELVHDLYTVVGQ